jgi:hypothetical protein
MRSAIDGNLIAVMAQDIQRYADYPGLWLTSSQHLRTYLFVDAEDRLQDFYLSPGVWLEVGEESFNGRSAAFKQAPNFAQAAKPQSVE